MGQQVVGVIMPAFNHGRYIGRAIDSLRAQTYPSWELVVVDDGSTDDTASVVKSYADSRIRYMYQGNRGVRQLAATINAGLAETSGELVTMFASDDSWPPYRLERQVPVFDDPEVILCYGRGHIIDESDRTLGDVSGPPGQPSRDNRPPGSILHDLFLSNFIFQPSVLIRRAALEAIGGYLQPEGLLAEDYPTHMALALRGEFRYLDLVLGNYRMHAQQMTRTHFSQMVETDMQYVLDFFRNLSADDQRRTGWNGDDLAAALSQRLNNTYFEVGRRGLLARDWKGARSQFTRALRFGNAKTRMKALIGLTFSLLHLDLETVARLSGRVPLR